MESEPRVTDPRPRERRRDRNSLRLFIGGLALGIVTFVVVFWVIARIDDQHYSAYVYIIVAFVGGGFMGILPLLALAYQDGKDAATVKLRKRGRADAPIEGAEAVDQGREARSGDHL